MYMQTKAKLKIGYCPQTLNFSTSYTAIMFYIQRLFAQAIN